MNFLTNQLNKQQKALQEGVAISQMQRLILVNGSNTI